MLFGRPRPMSEKPASADESRECAPDDKLCDMRGSEENRMLLPSSGLSLPTLGTRSGSWQ
jgi:hypothetical protein